MKISKLFSLLVLMTALLGFHPTLFAQQKMEEEQIAGYKEKVKEIINFLEYFLNTLGDKSTSTRDKDVIVNQSYTKIFRDAKVQVEDDLDEDRDVITNKDVQAYLKDIDFFFKTVKFDFIVEDISHYVNENGDLFFKVSMTRNLKGISIENDSINNTKKRFIEVNLDPEAQDFKIVSLYTNQFSQKEALSRWWNQLSLEWKAIFKRKAGLTQTATDTDIKNMSEIDELDISGNQYITNIDPLSQLTSLKRLNLSTTNISDLKPIRNLTRLEELDISHTEVANLEPLKYANSLKYLEAAYSRVNSIAVISRLPKLENLNLSHVPVTDFSSLEQVKELKTLDLSGTEILSLTVLNALANLKELNITSTQINTLEPVESLKSLEILKADSTPVFSLQPLKDSPTLKVLSINYTTIDDLSSLRDIETLERVYCDSSNISKEDANSFMSAHPGVLIIFESDDLKNWWAGLEVAWQNIIKKSVAISADLPSKEELAKITAIDSINFDQNLYIESLEPLSKLRKLRKIIASSTAIKDLEPLARLRNIEYLDISNTKVEDFSLLESMTQLEVVKANGTGLHHLDPLLSLNRLRLVEVDYTLIQATQVKPLLEKYPSCLVIFQTEYLEAWWADLSEEWKNILSQQTTISPQPNKNQLHKLIELEKVRFSDANVNDLRPLSPFLQLKELRFSGTAISDLSPLSESTSLVTLQASKSPLSNLAPIKNLMNLRHLDISNTPVDDMDALKGLYDLEELNCSGTQIKRLRHLDNLVGLHSLDCSNTNVKRLDEVDHLDLRVLKCYNTRISKRRVEDFRASNPDCNIIYY